MFDSIKFKLFLGLSLILFILNLMVMNDWSTVWNGAEAAMLWNSTKGNATAFLPEILLSFLIKRGVNSDFTMRLPGVLILLTSFAAFFWWGQKIFGKQSVLVIILVLGSSFLIPNFAKIATADTWLFAFQLGSLICLLFYLKAPTLGRRLIFYALFGISIWLHPLSSLLFFPGQALFLYFLHPSGKNILRLNPWLFAVIITPALHFTGALNWHNPCYVLGWGNSSFFRFFVYSLIGVLPFTPFLAGALRDLFLKFKKQEELTIIILPWLLISLLAQSPLFYAALAFLIGKQMLSWFDKNFPNRGIIRTVAILHLVLIFCAGIVILVGGFVQFKGIGYRAAVLFTGVYWALSFIMVIGLFLSNNWKLTIGAGILCGLVSTGIFWTRVMPVLEQERNLPKRVVETIENDPIDKNASFFIFQPSDKMFSNLAWYTTKLSNEVRIINDAETFKQNLKNNQNNIFLYEENPDISILDSTSLTKIEGRTESLRKTSILIAK